MYVLSLVTGRWVIRVPISNKRVPREDEEYCVERNHKDSRKLRRVVAVKRLS